MVYTDRPLKKLFSHLDSIKRVAVWAIELHQYSLDMWRQTLVDFVTQCSFSEGNVEGPSALVQMVEA